MPKGIYIRKSRPSGRIPTSPISRFLSKFTKSDECWEWQAGIDQDGYGKFWDGKNRISSHRYSWIFHFGNIPENLFVLHSCDNRKCVRPDHLFLGTNIQNMEDKIKKKRHSFGESNGQSKLKSNQIIEILSNHKNGISSKTMSNQFTVHKTSINNIIAGRTWKHINRKQANE